MTFVIPNGTITMMKVMAKDYINQIKDDQIILLPIERKIVPTIKEMAQAGGVHPNSIYKFLNTPIHRRVDLHILFGIISAFRNYGHDTQISNLIVFMEESQ